MRSRRFSWLEFVLSCCALAMAEPARALNLELRNQSSISMNPVLARNHSLLLVSLPLGSSRHPLTRDSHIATGLSADVNQHSIRFGPVLEFSPLLPIGVTLGYDRVQYWDPFGALQAFPSPHAAYDDDTLRWRRKTDLTYSAGGRVFHIEPSLSFSIGPFVASDRFSIQYWRIDLRGGDRVFYEPREDTLVARKGTLAGNDLDLILTPAGSLVIGARYTWLHAVYDDSDFDPSDADFFNPNTPQQKLGPIFAFIHKPQDSRWLHQTVGVLTIQWHLRHRWRAGENVSQAIPYVWLGFRVVLRQGLL